MSLFNYRKFTDGKCREIRKRHESHLKIQNQLRGSRLTATAALDELRIEKLASAKLREKISDLEKQLDAERANRAEDKKNLVNIKESLDMLIENLPNINVFREER